MGLLSIFQRKSGPGSNAAAAQDAVSIAADRRRARRRLLGAVVLVLAGVIGFPLLFDTAPRPLPIDMPIEIPRREGAPPLVAPPDVRSPKGNVASAEPQAAAAASAAGAMIEAPEQVAEKAAADAARAQAALEGKPAPATKPAETAERFVVQVGAFSEADSARDARARVEKLGFKTYTQVIDTSAGKRIRVRVGPYSDRAEAEKVAAKMKQAGIDSAVRTP